MLKKYILKRYIPPEKRIKKKGRKVIAKAGTSLKTIFFVLKIFFLRSMYQKT